MDDEKKLNRRSKLVVAEPSDGTRPIAAYFYNYSVYGLNDSMVSRLPEVVEINEIQKRQEKEQDVFSYGTPLPELFRVRVIETLQDENETDDLIYNLVLRNDKRISVDLMTEIMRIGPDIILVETQIELNG